MVAAAAARDYVQVMDIQPAMNARLVVMMRPSEKAAIERRARALDLSTSELVRRAAQAYDESLTPEQEAALGSLANELEAAVRSMRADLKGAMDAFADYQATKSRPVTA